ncbi:MAG: hypothetical protein HYR95_02120 [Candidatus Colwellbacteria bacterium]|nr:hypothetical protein [Candidatus Colwellbacteria bacterium]MBI3273667.1 hypothetical protein [Candidatus Colwellbacteria bacterium]
MEHSIAIERVVNIPTNRKRGEHLLVKAVVLSCVDPGFKEPFKALMRHLEFRSADFDHLGWAGGAKGLVDPGAPLLKQISTLVKLHHVPEVILMTHSDCGAYGYPKFPDENQEHEFYANELRRAGGELMKFLSEENLAPKVSAYHLDFVGAVRIF